MDLQGGMMTDLQERDNGLYILFAMLTIYSILFISIAVWNYEHFLCDASGDQLLFEQVVYNTAHGKPFYNNFSHQNHFGDHNSPILGIIALFTLILPAPYILSIFTVVSIAIAAIPIYLLSRDALGNKTPALLLAGCFLMLPALVGQIFVSFHEINLVLPFLTFTFYFFVRERFFPFIAMCLMAMLVKEDVAITLFMFAPYAVIRKKERRWYIFPAILSVAWFFISIKAIIPYFNGQKSYGVGLGYFSNLGASLTEIVVNTVKMPLKTLGTVLGLDRLWYLFVLLFPVGLILPLFSAEFLFAVPSVLLNMLAENTRFRLFVSNMDPGIVYIPRHMSLMAAVFIFIAAIYSIKKVSSFLPKRSEQIKLALVIFMLSVTLYDARYMMLKSFYSEVSDIDHNFPPAESIKKILALIPNEATVKSRLIIANHLYDKKESYYQANNPIETDYIVITRADESSFDPAYAESLHDKYTLISYENNVGLLKKN
jgi:uncharacterized membrane protein